MERYWRWLLILLVLAFSALAGWSEPRLITKPGGVADPQILAEGDTLHVVGEVTHPYDHIGYWRSTDAGETWGDPFWIDRTLDNSSDPALFLSGGRVYCIWSDGRPIPDTNIVGGVYLSIWEAEPDAIEEGDGNLPGEMGLSAHPNPFNSSTTITGADRAEVAIYDVARRLIETLKAENSSAVWEAKGLSSGVYFARVMGPMRTAQLAVVKLVLAK